MSTARFASTVLALAACSVIASACKQDTREAPGGVATIEAPDAATPRDHLAPGELVEGKVKVLGITLPSDFKLSATFPDMISAEGPAKPSDVANYLRARVPARSTTVGAASTIFEDVNTAPGRDLVVKVEPVPNGPGTRITIRDVSPPKPDGLTVDQRWQEAGLTPTGKIADPTHLH